LFRGEMLTLASLALCVAAIPATRLQAAEPTTQLLWPDGAPGALGNTDADKPEITVHLAPAEKANGTAVVICPGGGYMGLMMSYEGHDIATWLNQYGITGIVLKYRVNPNRHPSPMLDAQRAMRLVRSNAAAWKIDPKRIGMMGFSAGGHVASTVGTHFDAGNPKAADPIDRVSCRPDFLILVYPVITMGAKTHGGSRDVLLGANADPKLIDLLSNEKQVTTKTPPTFLAHARTDGLVSVANSQLFYAALQAHHVPSEFLELPTGEHGLGCGHGKEWEAWQAACVKWLETRKLLTTPAAK
jgi:acetyl esterase/lipase